jgi:hypothetical protein
MVNVAQNDKKETEELATYRDVAAITDVIPGGKGYEEYMAKRKEIEDLGKPKADVANQLYSAAQDSYEDSLAVDSPVLPRPETATQITEQASPVPTKKERSPKTEKKSSIPKMEKEVKPTSKSGWNGERLQKEVRFEEEVAPPQETVPPVEETPRPKVVRPIKKEKSAKPVPAIITKEEKPSKALSGSIDSSNDPRADDDEEKPLPPLIDSAIAGITSEEALAKQHIPDDVIGLADEPGELKQITSIASPDLKPILVAPIFS